MTNSLIFSEERFEFKKLKLNEHGHIDKASESAKNPFLYPNFNSNPSSSIYFLLYDPSIDIKTKIF